MEYWVEIAKGPWRSTSMTPIFNTNWKNPKMYVWCKFCDFSRNALWHTQATFPRILSQNRQNDLEGQNQLPPFSIPTNSVPTCMVDANMVIPVQICDELWCGQGKVYARTDGQTDRCRQWQYPLGLKWLHIRYFLVSMKGGFHGIATIRRSFEDLSSGILDTFNYLGPSDAIWHWRRHQAITCTNVDLSLVRSIDIHMRVILQEIP